MTRKQIPLSTEGDERRIVKHADMDLYEIRTGILFRKITYEVVHRPTGITSCQAWYATKKPDWATSDCIARVLDRQMVRMEMSRLDRQICERLR